MYLVYETSWINNILYDNIQLVLSVKLAACADFTASPDEQFPLHRCSSHRII